MIQMNCVPTAEELREAIAGMWSLSARKIRSIEQTLKPSDSAPVFTVDGRYTSRGWTEWTQGFQYGSALLQFDGTGDTEFLEIGRENTRRRMAPHLTHFGVHDHGFNNVSTYGNLLRLAVEGGMDADDWEREYYRQALRVSGSVQARRWTALPDDAGYVYSFNGPHSLFADTIRSMRALAVSHLLGHALLGENDLKVSLLDRLIRHARTTAAYNVYYGEGRDAYDISGRVAHESIFNLNDGCYRCPSSQQGYSPFTTWTRGLAWVMLGYAEQLEFLEILPDDALESSGGRAPVEAFMRRAAEASCDFYIRYSPVDGVPYWDTGAPGLAALGDYLDRPAEPFNAHEPVDSSAAAIAVQGLLRLGRYLQGHGEKEKGDRFWRAGRTTLHTLLSDTYLSRDEQHQGLLLHSIYHRPNGWDHVPAGQSVPCGESSMWGDYHLREAVLYLQRTMDNRKYLTFFGGAE